MNIYVGNLSYEVTQDDLQQLFAQHGEVSTVNVIMDKFTGRSKGFGFVEMPKSDQAQAAIAKVNGVELKGRALNVNEARPKTDKPKRDRW